VKQSIHLHGWFQGVNTALITALYQSV